MSRRGGGLAGPAHRSGLQRRFIARATLLVAVPVLLVSMLALLPGCEGEIVDYTVGSGPISAKTGSLFDINLKADQSTGYLWSFKGVPESGILKLVSTEYITPGKALEIPGMGESGAQTWRFKAEAPGAATLVFEYYPVNRKPQDVAQKVESFQVEVHP